MGVAGGAMPLLNESEVEHRDMWPTVMPCLWGSCSLMNGNFS